VFGVFSVLQILRSGISSRSSDFYSIQWTHFLYYRIVMNKTCAACPVLIDNNDYFECSKCNEYFHYMCLGYHAFEDITSELKASWLCPSCLNKQPKGDNTNSMVRPSTPTGLAELTFVATRRKVANKLVQPPPPPSISLSSESVSQIDLRNIIREEMKLAVQSCVSEINKTLNERLQELCDQYSDLKSGVEFINQQFELLKTNVVTHNEELKSLKAHNELLQKEVNSMNYRLKQLDQLSRSCNLEIQCVPEHRSENVVNLVKQLGQVVKQPVSDTDIQYCSRISKMDSSSTRPRSILLKLGSPRMRDSLLSAVITYNKTNPNNKLNTGTLGIDDKKSAVFVMEHLSPENKSLHAAARVRAKELNYKFVWVRGGRIFLRKSEPIYVRDHDVLKKLT
jgi:hypothetical protein